MGVYVFKFLGDSGDGITWCKVGFHGTLDPWRRLCGSGFVNVRLPTEEMLEQMNPDQFELLYWWSNLGCEAEQKIHAEFTGIRRGEWYRVRDIERVVQFVGHSFANCIMTLSTSTRCPHTLTPCEQEWLANQKKKRMLRMFHNEAARGEKIVRHRERYPKKILPVYPPGEWESALFDGWIP